MDKVTEKALLAVLKAADDYMGVDPTSFTAATLRTTLAQAVEGYHHRYGTCSLCYKPFSGLGSAHQSECQECGETVHTFDCMYDSDVCRYCAEREGRK